MASFPGQPGQAGTRKVKPIWILLEQQMMGWQWHQLDHMQIIASCSRQVTMPAPHHLIFYRPDALPDAQPTVCRVTKKKWLKTENETALTGNPFVMGKFMLNITMRARNRVAVSTGLAASHNTLPAMHTQKGKGKGFPVLNAERWAPS